MNLEGPSRTQGREVRYKCCPACNSNDWSVSLSEETGQWYCYRCSAKGVDAQGQTLSALRLKLQRTRPDQKWGEASLPPWKALSRAAREYLGERGLLFPERFGLVEHAEAPRILIPYFGPHGSVIYWNTRAYRFDGKPKYMGAPGVKPPYVLPRWAPHDDVTLVEGPFDAMIMHLASGRPCIALGGTSLSPAQLRALSFLAPNKRKLLLDYDALRPALLLKQQLGCEVIRLEEGDPADNWKEEAIAAQIHDKKS